MGRILCPGEAQEGDLDAWLALALRSSAKDILALNREGTTVQSVKYETLKQFELSVAPLDEQKRIVAKVEELLADVNKVRRRLGKVPKILKAFRQSVLAAACSGRLSEDWRKHNPAVISAQATLERFSQKAAKTKVRRSVPEHVPMPDELSQLGTGKTPT